MFPKYEKYRNINKTYKFFQKLIEVANKIAPLKTARIKNASSEWFDRETAEKLSLRGKLFKKFKSSRSKKLCLKLPKPPNNFGMDQLITTTKNII